MPIEFRTPLTLEGRFVRLVPLSIGHLDALVVAGGDPAVWEFTRTGDLRDPQVMRKWIETLLQLQGAGETLAFVQTEQPSGISIGMTRFLTIDRAESHVEIGGTWLTRRAWNTPINTESKFLMLRHAFETEHCHRVEFKTDLRNHRSQRAIERLGAVREGTTREHIQLAGGYWRSSVRYGMVDHEWPAARARLLAFLQQPWPRPAH